MKSIFSFFLCIMLVCPVLSGCRGSGNAGIPSESGTDQSASAGNPSAPAADEVVARVGDTEILYSQLAEQMVMLEAMYSGLLEQFTSEQLQEKLHDAALSSLEILVSQQILNSKIDEYGLTLTPEEQEEANQAWDQTIEDITNSVKQDYPDLTGEDLDAMVQSALEISGKEKQTVVDNAVQSILVRKLKEQVMSETPRPDRQRVEEFYASLLAEQREQFDQDVTQFESAMIMGEPVVYVPRDYRIIQEIQLKFDDEVVQLLNQMEPYDTDDSDSYEEMLALEYQRLREESVPGLYRQLEEGVSFSQLMEAIKPGSSSTFNYVCEDTTRLSQEYQQAALSISQPGETSDTPVQQNRGYTILYWADSLKAGEIPLEEVYDLLEQQLLEEDRNQTWTDLQSQWRQEARVEIFEDRLGY